MDENVDPLYIKQLRRKMSDLVVWSVGEPNTPSKGTLDPEILLWCEAHDFILVTNNRTSMPTHLADHLAQDHHIPGIFILNSALSVGETIDELLLIVEFAWEGEYQDQIVHLPIP
ncbi:MAG: DUF5615 family PIN-like protein [Microcystaceae cyanobacterium]